METKLSFRFLNTKEGQDKAHAKYKELCEQGHTTYMTIGAKYVIVHTEYFEEQ